MRYHLALPVVALALAGGGCASDGPTKEQITDALKAVVPVAVDGVCAIARPIVGAKMTGNPIADALLIAGTNAACAEYGTVPAPVAPVTGDPYTPEEQFCLAFKPLPADAKGAVEYNAMYEEVCK